MEYTFEPEYEGVIYYVSFDEDGELIEISYCTEEGEEISTEDTKVLPRSIWEELAEELVEKMQEREEEEFYKENGYPLDDYERDYVILERWIIAP